MTDAGVFRGPHPIPTSPTESSLPVCENTCQPKHVCTHMFVHACVCLTKSGLKHWSQSSGIKCGLSLSLRSQPASRGGLEGAEHEGWNAAHPNPGPAPRQELSELGLNGVAHEKREGMRGPCRVSKNVAMGMRRDLHSVHEPVGSSGQRARSWRALKTREE